ncbi:vegetative cell wall protein gp1-like [Miscanthus floridulus]|uniref:vegetative cell wall protein gp1-like n=1 Tax=Miscanthus floridulus TaxID=154761 RepID=UPI00345A2D36
MGQPNPTPSSLVSHSPPRRCAAAADPAVVPLRRGPAGPAPTPPSHAPRPRPAPPAPVPAALAPALPPSPGGPAPVAPRPRPGGLAPPPQRPRTRGPVPPPRRPRARAPATPRPRPRTGGPAPALRVPGRRPELAGTPGFELPGDSDLAGPELPRRPRAP